MTMSACRRNSGSSRKSTSRSHFVHTRSTYPFWDERLAVEAGGSEITAAGRRVQELSSVIVAERLVTVHEAPGQRPMPSSLNRRLLAQRFAEIDEAACLGCDEQEATRFEDTRKLLDPFEVRVFVEMREYGIGVDDVEEPGGKLHWWQRRHYREPSVGEGALTERDDVRIDIGA